MIASIQAFIVLGALLELLLGGFVLYFFALFMQTRLKAVSYVYLYAVADPFVLLSVALFYSQASQLLDLSKNKRLTLSLIYLIIQYVKIIMGFIINDSYLTL